MINIQYGNEFSGSRTVYVYVGKWIFLAEVDWYHFGIGIDWRPVYPGSFYIKLICFRFGVSNG
jgi:hypothetical protein